MQAVKMRVREIREINVDGLNDRIRQSRLAIAHQKSLEKICGEVGVSKTYWYSLEQNRINGALSIENLRKIEQSLGVDFGVKI